MRVFISYRRDDAKWQAREIYRALTQVLPREHVFMDVDSIPPGADFVDVLEGWVGQCDIQLVLIGAGWLDAMDPKTGRRRLENPNDFVRIEVRTALSRGIPVVPVMLDGAAVPESDRLPEDLKRLVRRNAEFVEHRTVDADVERLIRRLGLASGSAPGAAATRVPTPTSEGERMIAALRSNPSVVSVSAPTLTPLSPTMVDALRPTTTAPQTPDQRYRSEGRIKVDAKIIHGAPDGWFLPGNGKAEWFKDIDFSPEMVVAPAGSFIMGSPDRRLGTSSPESSRPCITISRPFAVGKSSVTRGEFAEFLGDAGHKIPNGAFVWTSSGWELDRQISWRSPGFLQDDSHPIVCVSWEDAKAYTKWLSEKTGKPYRLLSDAEREYVTRAGTTTPYWWGSSISPSRANFDRKATVRGQSFEANPWGLYNVHGNVWDWCEDLWHNTLSGIPTDGSAWVRDGKADHYVRRGGSWSSDAENIRSDVRYGDLSTCRYYTVGFRVARSLDPV